MRRLSRAGALLVGWCILSAVGIQAQVLTHGPVVGGVTASNANVFVRTDQAVSVAIQYGTDETLAGAELSLVVTTSSNHDFTAIIPLTDLPAQTTIYLNVIADGLPQFSGPPYPSFPTFPATTSPRDFKFIALSDFAETPLLTNTVATYASASQEGAAFAFIGGDFDHRDPPTLFDKRAMFQNLYDPNSPFMGDFVRLILWKLSIAHHWDDHDFGLNNSDKTYPDALLAQQVFEEYVPTYPLPSVKPGIWQRFRYAHAEFFVLDGRSQRDPNGDFDGAAKSMLDGNALGLTGQWEWLKAGLRASTARWKFIFTSVPANPTVKPFDGWPLFQTEWRALRSYIYQNRIRGVVFLSGDFHMGAIDNGEQSGFPEMCVPSPNLPNAPRCNTGSTPGNWSEGVHDATCTGYSVVTILTNPDRVQLEVKDAAGITRVSYGIVAADPQRPTAPKLLAPVVAGSRWIDLRWEPGSDNVAVTGHQIFRNDKLLARTSGATTTFSDTTVSPSTPCQYRVRAFDWAGNVSSNSNPVGVTSLAPDAQRPTVASNLTAQAIGPTQIRVRWKKSSDNRGITAYDLYRDYRLHARLPAATTNFVDGTVLPLTSYRFFVRARDGDGNVSGPSNSAIATTPEAPP